jgi:hypothetical protein
MQSTDPMIEPSPTVGTHLLLMDRGAPLRERVRWQTMKSGRSCPKPYVFCDSRLSPATSHPAGVQNSCPKSMSHNRQDLQGCETRHGHVRPTTELPALQVMKKSRLAR